MIENVNLFLRLSKTYSAREGLIQLNETKMSTHAIHIYAVGVGPGVLVGLYEPVCELLGDDMEGDEFLDGGLHLVVFLRTLVQPQHNGRHVPEYRRTHQRWKCMSILVNDWGNTLGETTWITSCITITNPWIKNFHWLHWENTKDETTKLYIKPIIVHPFTVNLH